MYFNVLLLFAESENFAHPHGFPAFDVLDLFLSPRPDHTTIRGHMTDVAHHPFTLTFQADGLCFDTSGPLGNTNPCLRENLSFVVI